MKKGVIIVLVLVVIAIIGGAIYFILRSASPSGTPTNTINTLPPVGTSTVATSTTDNGTSSFPAGSTFQIGTNQGVVTVSNFYKTMDYITEDNAAVVMGEGDDYSVVYNRDDSSFGIVLTLVPGSLQDARTAAEAVFMKQVGVSEGDACKLNVSEGVTDKTSQYYGDSFGLSFCSSTVIQ